MNIDKYRKNYRCERVYKCVYVLVSPHRKTEKEIKTEIDMYLSKDTEATSKELALAKSGTI